MILWKDLSIDSIPKDGTRCLIAHYGKTYAYNEELKCSYEIQSFGEIDIVQFNWEFPERNTYMICSKDYVEVTFEEILSRRYNKFCCINTPILMRAEDLDKLSVEGEE
jgi:hypothetical protein